MDLLHSPPATLAYSLLVPLGFNGTVLKRPRELIVRLLVVAGKEGEHANVKVPGDLVREGRVVDGRRLGVRGHCANNVFAQVGFTDLELRQLTASTSSYLEITLDREARNMISADPPALPPLVLAIGHTHRERLRDRARTLLLRRHAACSRIRRCVRLFRQLPQVPQKQVQQR